MKGIHLGDVVSSGENIGYYHGASNFSDPERLKIRLHPVVQPYYGPVKTIRPYFIYDKREIPILVEYERTDISS